MPAAAAVPAAVQAWAPTATATAVAAPKRRARACWRAGLLVTRNLGHGFRVCSSAWRLCCLLRWRSGDVSVLVMHPRVINSQGDCT